MENSGFLKILRTFDRAALAEKLYCEPAVCYLAFRELPELSRNIVARLLWVQSSVSLSNVIHGNVYGKTYSESLKILNELAIITESNTEKSTYYELASSFRSSLRTIFCGGGAAWTKYPPPGDSSKTTKSVEYLERYALERWECLLYTLASPQLKEGDASVGGISKEARNLLVKADLLQVADDDSSMGDDKPLITPRGFQFLLLDKRSQAWILASALVGKQDPSHAAAILLSKLALFRPSTVEYSTTDFTPEQLQVLACLREFGFVYQRSSKLPRFYCTSLASVLSSTNTSAQIPLLSHNHGHIAVETNFRLYAYTESRLDAALLSMFAEPICRFKNLIVAAITRDSFRKALNVGITAQQVIDFLKSRTKADSDSAGQHGPQKPSFLHQPPIPPAVADQMHIWELERHRLRYQKAFLYSNFDTPSDYTMLREYADQIGCLQWNPEDAVDGISRKQMMIVTPDGHDKLRSFWRRRRKPDASS